MKQNSLGPLEQEVMRWVWEKKRTTVRAVAESLATERSLAYTTVQTVMNRLVEKGYLDKRKQEKICVYSPRVGKNIAISQAIKNTMDSFLQSFGEEALVAFVDGLDSISDETRRQMIAKLKKK